MDFQALVAKSAEGEARAKARDFVGAAQIYRELGESDLSDLDRSGMFMNAATCLAYTDQTADIEPLYDAGIALERPWYRGQVRAGKAEWLYKQGRRQDAAAIYSELLGEPWLTFDEQRRYEELRFHCRS